MAILTVSAEPTISRQEPQTAVSPDEAARGEAMVVLPDGRRLHLKCSGTGEPTVILDAGLGLDSSVWTRVQPELAEITRTCAYDRAGYGQSDPGPLPRDSAHRASDLLGMLEATVENGPFVLVAHSAAELTARIVTERRPDLIAGLILVDPGADLERLKTIGPVWAAAYAAGQSAALKCIRATAAGEMRPGNPIYVECGSPPTDGPLASREMAAAVLSENEPDSAGIDERQRAQGSLGDVSLIVLTAENKFGANEGAAPAETQPLRRAWSEAGAMIAASSSRGEQRMVPEASHVIQFEQPQAVIDAVRDVVERARSGTESGESTS
ncbi:alpha/beta hydrolase [uncultured Brevundimonas sp.]|uniref:alpha/beta fold hydrolase n=1 Tax=uncultured Brevundimonas sp. TaxID=213418 RepID=UPI0026379007|nr:alpha/beta hydrolase [uncultured Brevundimonas sp.]